MKSLFYLIVFTLSAFSAAGQKIWTLEECINRALSENLTIQTSELDIQTNEINLRQSKEARYPSVNASIGNNINLGRTVDPTTNTFNNEAFFANNYNVQSGVLLYNGGRIKNTIEQIELNTKASKLTKEQRERDIALNVATLYLNALLAKENRTIAQNNLSQSQAQLDQIQKLINGGLRPENEKYNLEAQIANNEQAIIAANNNVNLSLLRLRQALFLESNQPFDIQSVNEDISIVSDPSLLTEDEVYDAAKTHQRSIQAAEYALAAATKGIDIQRAQLYPSLTLGGFIGTNYSNKGRTAELVTFPIMQDVTIQGVPVTIESSGQGFNFSNTPYATQIDNNLSYGFALNLSIPIYNNFTGKGAVERAKIGAKSQELNLELEKQTLRINVSQALADAKAAKSTLDAAQKSLLAQEKAYDNTLKRLEIGTANSFELINSKTLLDNATLNALLSKYDYIFRTKVLDFYLGLPIKL